MNVSFGTRHPRASHRRPQSNQLGKKAMVVFGLFFILPGLAVGYFLGVRPMLQVQRAQTWPAASATVLSSEVRTHRGSDSTTYSIQISYSYTWEGQEYTSDRYDFSMGSSSGRESKARVVRAFPRGHRFEAYVNPDNPAEAVINRDFQGLYLALLGFGAVFVIAGLAVAVGGVRANRPGGSSDTRSFLPPLPKADSRGNILLKPEHSPWAKVFGVLVFALFWNGIISVFIFQAWKGWQNNSPEVFLMIFLIPFVLIGIGAVLAFFYSLLAAFNPRLLLLLSPTLPRPGDTFTLDWEFQGSPGRLEHYNLTLEGLERIEYTTGSGKNSSTHVRESLFYQRELLRNDSPSRMSENTLTVDLPPDLPHSFKAPNNQILWRIRLHGPIRFWPDLKQTFPLVVPPRSAS
ncbi:MAG: DUF3592 domain-containing protein [Verrucomicrobia bacterium]|nr:DUF3592 domain-containing protein [Verrucomicrobiota bacterium]MCH8527501.1 DUF3592 domain-containing protein [Kiritimatiellia bacterium]